jgi:hypothetical protein
VAGKAEAPRRKRIIHLKTAKALGIGLHHDIEEALANAGKTPQPPYLHVTFARRHVPDENDAP